MAQHFLHFVSFVVTILQSIHNTLSAVKLNQGLPHATNILLNSQLAYCSPYKGQFDKMPQPVHKADHKVSFLDFPQQMI